MKAKVTIKKAISLTTSMMLIASMALATQGEIKVESDTIQMQGKVGIGTIDLSSNHKLLIDSTGTLGLKVFSNLSTSGAYLQLVNDTGRLLQFSSSGSTVGGGQANTAQFHYNGVEHLRFDGNGNVSIPNGGMTVAHGINSNNNIYIKTQNDADWGIQGINLAGNTSWSLGQWYAGNAALGLSIADGTRTILLMSQGESKLGGGNVSIPNGNGYLKEGQAIKFTNDGSSTGTVKAGLYVNSDSSLELKTNSTQTTGLKIDSNQKVTIPGNLDVSGELRVNGQTIAGSSGVNGSVSYSGGTSDTGTSYAGDTVMASGRFTNNNTGDTTVTLPFSWEGGTLSLQVSDNPAYWQGESPACSMIYTTYDALNGSYTSGRAVRHALYGDLIDNSDIYIVDKGSNVNEFIFKAQGAARYVTWQVIAPKQ